MNSQETRVASTKCQHFHRATCDWAGYFLRAGNFLEFDHRDEAIGYGLKPCKTCCS